MKVSKETINILKNFAGINSNILLDEGNTLMSITTQKNILAKVTVSDEFPSKFGIYDITEFLGALSLFSDPDVEFTSKYVTIKQGSSSIRYYAAEENILVVPNSTQFEKIGQHFDDTVVEFDLTSDFIDSIKKTASILKAPDISFVSDGKNVKVVVGDKNNETSNSYEIDVGPATSDEAYKVNLKVDNLRILPGSYTVSVSSKRSSRFQSKDSDLVYYIAVEADSEI